MSMPGAMPSFPFPFPLLLLVLKNKYPRQLRRLRLPLRASRPRPDLPPPKLGVSLHRRPNARKRYRKSSTTTLQRIGRDPERSRSHANAPLGEGQARNTASTSPMDDINAAMYLMCEAVDGLFANDRLMGATRRPTGNDMSSSTSTSSALTM